MQLNSQIKSNEALLRAPSAERLEQIFKTQVVTFHTAGIVVEFGVPPPFFRWFDKIYTYHSTCQITCELYASFSALQINLIFVQTFEHLKFEWRIGTHVFPLKQL